MSVPTYQQRPVYEPMNQKLPAVYAHPEMAAPQFVYREANESTMAPNRYEPPRTPVLEPKMFFNTNNVAAAPPTFSNLNMPEYAQSPNAGVTYTQAPVATTYPQTAAAPQAYTAAAPQTYTAAAPQTYTNSAAPMGLTSFDLTPRMQAMLGEKYRQYMAEYGGDDSYDPNKLSNVYDNVPQGTHTHTQNNTYRLDEQHVKETQGDQHTETAVEEASVAESRHIDAPEERHTQKSNTHRSKQSSHKYAAHNVHYETYPRYHKNYPGGINQSTYDSKSYYSNLPSDRAPKQQIRQDKNCCGKKSRHCC